MFYADAPSFPGLQGLGFAAHAPAMGARPPAEANIGQNCVLTGIAALLDDTPTACDPAELRPHRWWRLQHESLRIASLLSSGCAVRGLLLRPHLLRAHAWRSFCTRQRPPTCLALPTETPCPSWVLMTLFPPPHRQRRAGSPALLVVLLCGRNAGGASRGVAAHQPPVGMPPLGLPSVLCCARHPISCRPPPLPHPPASIPGARHSTSWHKKSHPSGWLPLGHG